MFDLDFKQERELKFSLSITAISSHFLEKPLRKENFISSIYFSHFSTILLQSCRSQNTFLHSFFLYKFQIQKDKCENNFTNFFFLSYKIYSHFLYFIFDNLNN